MPAITSERLERDRKSTRLNSSHSQISYAVFCLKKKNKPQLLLTIPFLLHCHKDHKTSSVRHVCHIRRHTYVEDLTRDIVPHSHADMYEVRKRAKALVLKSAAYHRPQRGTRRNGGKCFLDVGSPARRDTPSPLNPPSPVSYGRRQRNAQTYFFFLNNTAPPEISSLPPPAALRF